MDVYIVYLRVKRSPCNRYIYARFHIEMVYNIKKPENLEFYGCFIVLKSFKGDGIITATRKPLTSKMMMIYVIAQCPLRFNQN